MAYRVEMHCYKCGEDFEVRNDCPPMEDEGGFINKAECPHCGADCGEISVMLTIK